MGEIRDAIKTLDDVKTEFSQAGVYSAKRSISSAAMDGTASFPILVPDTMSLDDVMLISRATEKKYASFLLTVLTGSPYLEVSKGETPTASAYLKQFHQNMRVKDSDKLLPNINLTSVVSDSYTMVETDLEYATMEDAAYHMAYCLYEGVKDSIPQNKHVELNYTLEEVINPEVLNNKFKPVREAKNPNSDIYVPLSFAPDPDKIKSDYGNAGKGDSGHGAGSGVNYIDNDVNINKGAVQVNIDKDAFHIGKDAINNTTQHTIVNKIDADKLRAATTPPRVNVRDRGTQWKPLTDNDCKKANDLVPTLLHIRVYPIDKFTREELTPIDFIMGIKCTVHPIPIGELARMVVCGMRNENFVFNFLRWTTGEIKFFKDFLFAVDTIKMDAKDAGNDVTGWRPALKRRRNLSKTKIHLTNKSIMPNATLVVSTEDIEYIKDTYGYDLGDERIVRRMMDVYFLLGYVEVNVVSQRATFRFDGINSTDTYTFEGLRRENQNDDKAFKNMMKMLGRSM